MAGSAGNPAAGGAIGMAGAGAGTSAANAASGELIKKTKIRAFRAHNFDRIAKDNYLIEADGEFVAGCVTAARQCVAALNNPI